MTKKQARQWLGGIMPHLGYSPKKQDWPRLIKAWLAWQKRINLARKAEAKFNKLLR